jgi:hypothetical protein
MPPAIAAKFSTSELAVLKVIGEEVVKHGLCSHSGLQISPPSPTLCLVGKEFAKIGGRTRSRLPDYPASKIADLLPWSWQAARLAVAA